MFLSDPRDTDITFGTPGDNAPFTWLRPEDIPDNAYTDTKAVDRGIEQFFAGVRAAERQTRLVDIINSQNNALAEAADHRIRTVREQTGIELENPFRGGYAIEARRRIRDELQAGGNQTLDEAGVPNWQRRIFEERIAEVGQNFPNKAPALDFGQSLEDQAQAIAKSAAYDGEHADGGFMASIAGGLMGSVTGRDPLFFGSLFAGPGLSTAETVLARVGFGALKQGLFNAGLQAAAQPAVQDWRRTIGERNGVVPALENVGMAFIMGAIPGAGIEGVRALAGADRAALARITGGVPRPGDTETVARAIGAPIERNATREIEAGHADVANDTLSIGDVPPGVTAAEHADIAGQAVRFAEDPANNPPPDIPVTALPRDPGQARVIDEAAPAAIGERQQVDGKPVTFARFDPAELQTDAAAFQYKGGGDAAGVTDRLKFVTAFDPLASGKTLVFERRDGARVIADGHQRLGLAKRLGANDASVKLDGYVFREADGWTAEDVRAIAAKKNMQEGSGDALDAARVLRDRPDLLDGSMPVTSPMMKSAVALSRLSDEAFGMAVNGVVPPNYAAAVGAMVPDQVQHASVLADLVRFAPETEREARLLIGEVMAAGFRAEEQINLFGAADLTRSLMGERIKVLDAAMQALMRDKKLFGTLAEKADAIEAAGNQLARASNDARAQDAAQLADLLTRLARRTGPVSDALNRAAAQMADGMKSAKAADAFLDEVNGLLDRSGLSGLLASPELKPVRIVEPGTPEAVAMADGPAAESSGSLFDRMPTNPPEPAKATPEASLSQETASQPSLFDDVVVAGRDDGRDAVLMTRADALAEADKSADHAMLVETCKG